MSTIGRLHTLAYRAGSTAIVWCLGLPWLPRLFTWSAKIWLRHARIANHLASAEYDQILDGGANIGEFATLVRAKRPKVPLLCIEPHPEAAATLRRRGFEVIQAALWSDEGEAVLTQPTEASTSATLLNQADGDLPSWTVRTVRLDQLPIVGERVLIKLDLQGAEAEALSGLEGAWDRIAGLILEVGLGPGGNYHQLRRIMEDRGFLEAATFNELEIAGTAIEADKLWIRQPSTAKEEHAN